MNRLKCLVLAVALVEICLSVNAPKVEAQIIVDIGAEPECPYGYYDFAPYACAPYGYYAPEWFVGGDFVGAGPWFHGPANFLGHVDSRFDVRRGYKGQVPNRGDSREASKPVEQIDHFSGDEMHDARGHVGGGRR
jgi:hypothetical protein